ncbi:MAG TPA: imelysin family protein [Puia sp.]|nr:imelysin family protein [Puia sp.]
MKRTTLWVSGLGICVTGLILFLAACSKSGGKSSTPPDSTTDTVLVNLGTNIIIPSYQQLATTSATLDAAVGAFNTSPTLTTLDAVQTAFVQAYKAWAACSELEFGPAADLYLTTHFTNSFPADTALIKANAGGASYVIDGLGNYAAQGFPALDYLLFAYGNDATLARFTTAGTASGARQYLAALTASLKSKTAAVATAWNATGGNYIDRFSKGVGTDAGSSLSLLVNALVMDFDVNLQNYKIGIPIGQYGPSVLPKSPTKVEGYYGDLSDVLLVTQIKAFQNLYTGAAGGGLDDKVAATNAQSNGGSLNDAIKTQWNTLLTKMQALPDPLSDGIQNNNSAVNDAYTAVRQMTVLLKVDMSSALGIKISFQDDDGD